MNSRNKGKRGELEFVHFLKARGIEARRGQQFAGGGDSPDVMAGNCFEHVHIEVKRCESGNPYNWLAQAIHDAAEGKVPLVAHKRNGKGWIAIVDMDHFIQLLELAHAQLAK